MARRRRLQLSLTVFSLSGKLVQIEHALTAVSQGTTSLGIKATYGIVIATEKKSSFILIHPSMLDKVAAVCPNFGLVYSGMGPDFRVLVKHGRSHRRTGKSMDNTHRLECSHRRLRPSCSRRLEVYDCMACRC
ncbi:nucleophile aminohydrolase [Gautieria morchelliformis]|nr:nucleophile aminohydrolase [Gautieria morchelliformis]